VKEPDQVYAYLSQPRERPSCVMKRPAFVAFPPPPVRSSIRAEEWAAYLNAWVGLGQTWLQMKTAEFRKAIDEDLSLLAFLNSYFELYNKRDTTYGQNSALERTAYLLLHRTLTELSSIPSDLLTWKLLANFCSINPRSDATKRALASAWPMAAEKLDIELSKLKTTLVSQLEPKGKGKDQLVEANLQQLLPLAIASSDAAVVLATGSDFIDSLFSNFETFHHTLQQLFIGISYQCLIYIVEGDHPNFSLLSDHLYSIEAITRTHRTSKPGTSSLLEYLTTHSPLIDILEEKAKTAASDRIKTRIASLRQFQTPGVTPYRRSTRAEPKGKQLATSNAKPSEVIGVQDMSLITQVQDLFPELGSSFIMKLLSRYQSNVEEVIALILEDNFPPDLRDADRSEDIPVSEEHKIAELEPRSSLPVAYERRNVYDDDEFDQLLVDTSKIYIGSQNPDITADDILKDRDAIASKAAVLAALAAFDQDDDERDDTYDAADVGGTVDQSMTESFEQSDHTEGEDAVLFQAFNSNPEVFERDAKTRRSAAREALKIQTGLTDEGIEGWAIMLRRNPSKIRRLEIQFSDIKPVQREIARTSYRKESGTEDSEGDAGGQDNHSGFRGRGGRGQGRPRARGRGRGDVAGPTDDRTTQAARHNKEANKSSRANHNRREGRAKKLARAGFPT
jgi:activating signal cointegrator complex subunit 2